MATATQSVYQYKGKNKQGKPIKGELSSTNIALVKAKLRKQGIITSSVKKKPKPIFQRSKPIQPADIAVFTRQMSTMMRAGVPLVQSFNIVAEGVEKDTMRQLINTIQGDVSAGISFAAALRRHPKYFDDLFCGLVEAGEHSGSLETMLDRVATYKEKTERLKAKIKKALTYPAAVIAVAIIVTTILLVKVVPVFAEVFGNFGAELPAFTLFVLNVSEVVQKWWLAVLITIMASLYAFKEALLRSPKFSDMIDKLTLKTPLIGGIIYEAIIARFARTLSTTFAAGVPLIDSLLSVSSSAGNAVYRDAILQVKDDVATGIQLNTALKTSGLFPTLLIQLTSIGEESGTLDEMLDNAADHYEALVDDKVDNLTALLEPMIMAVLGIFVGGLLIAMYLPIFNLGNVI